MLFCGTKNKKIHQRIWIFVIYDKSILKIQEYKLKNCFTKEVHETVEARGELAGNKTTKIFLPKPIPEANLGNVVVIPPEKRQEILNNLRQI